MLTVAPLAYSKELITDDVLDKATMETRSARQNALSFLTAIRDCIQVDPQAFYAFLDVLRSEPAFAALVAKLEA